MSARQETVELVRDSRSAIRLHLSKRQRRITGRARADIRLDRHAAAAQDATSVENARLLPREPLVGRGVLRGDARDDVGR